MIVAEPVEPAFLVTAAVHMEVECRQSTFICVMNPIASGRYFMDPDKFLRKPYIERQLLVFVDDCIYEAKEQEEARARKEHTEE